MFRANLDGSSAETIVRVTIRHPHGVAVFADEGKLYFTDDELDAVFRANLDGTRLDQLPIAGISVPGEVAIDPLARKLYWTDTPSGPTVRRANLDGSGVEVVVSRATIPSLARAIGVCVDSLGGRIYFTDAELERGRPRAAHGSGRRRSRDPGGQRPVRAPGSGAGALTLRPPVPAGSGLRAAGARVPHGRGHGLGVAGEHDIEAEADAELVAAVGRDRVLQPRGEQQQRSGAHAHDDLIGVLARQLADGRADDAGLRPWIVKGDGVGPFGVLT